MARLKVLRQKLKGMSRKKKIRLVAICTAALILILGAGYTVFLAPRLKQEKWIYKEAAVERGTLTAGVTESGALDYGVTDILYELDLTVAEDSDDEDDDGDEDDEETVQRYLRVENVYVTPGQRVEEGSALVKFTDDSVNSVRKLLQSALVDAKSSCNEAESEYDLAVLEAETDYETKLVSEKYAATVYQNSASAIDDEIAALQVEIRQRTNQVGKLEEKVAEALEDYSDAEKDYAEAKEYLDQADRGNAVNFMTVQSDYLSAQTRYQNAKTELEQAQENLEDNAAQITSLENRLTDAKARRSIDRLEAEETYQESVINGENAQITYDAKVESLKETLREEEEDRQKIEEQLAAFEEFVGTEGILYADGEGIITEVGFEEGDRLTDTGSTVVAYAKPDDMTITVDVTQEDVTALAVGDRVDIRFLAYSDEVWEGSILSINTTATSRESATVSYEVVIGVEGDTRALYGGMTAEVTFVTEEKEDVLYVSRKAIVEQDGKTYVYVKQGANGYELQEVLTGLRNSTSVEIVSGLEEGDVIYIASRVSSEEELEAQDTDENAATSADTAAGTDGNGMSGADGGWPGMNGEGADGGWPERGMR